MTATTLHALKMEQREARRELILSAARALFAEKDFRSVTAREIAGRAGVSPGTLYRYYENLDELFLEVLFSGARDIMDLLDRELDGENGCSIARFCRVYVNHLNTNMTFYQMMSHFMLGGNLSPETTVRIDPAMRGLLDRVERVVAETAIGDDTRLVSHALFSSLNGLMISYARYPGRTPEEIRRHTLRLAGIIARRFEAA
jgi:AcrR family transcriptional regulator